MPLPALLRPLTRSTALPRLRRLGAGLALPLLLAACGGGDARMVVCTAVFRPAVSVQPVDELGRPLEGVQISWRLNGGSLQAQTCLLLPCAVDSRGGQYELLASKAGYASVTVSLQIAHDECHAQTQDWKPVLRRL